MTERIFIRSKQWTRAAMIGFMLTLWVASPVWAHQPYFEEGELTAESPYVIADISISLAFYGSLAVTGDVDYFTFLGKQGESVLLRIVIPMIDGQESFTPTLVLWGPGLPLIDIPAPVKSSGAVGGLILRARSGKPTIFYEPFGARNYYERQEQTISLPADGLYTVAIWSESGQIGRYTFSPGTREIFGGDRNYWQKSEKFWTPLPTSPVIRMRCTQ